MDAKLYRLCISPEVLRRGFWLYIWRIKLQKGSEVLYVGRTGDSSSLNAQSPFSRISGHLGPNKRANALRRHLKKCGIEVEDCEALELVTYGPVFPEGGNEAEHHHRRDKTAALERDLRDAMEEAGYRVLNRIRCRKRSDPDELERVLSAFAESFPYREPAGPHSERPKAARD